MFYKRYKQTYLLGNVNSLDLKSFNSITYLRLFTEVESMSFVTHSSSSALPK